MEKAPAAALIIEDADSPTPHPVVHAMACRLAGEDRSLAEGALKSDSSAGEAMDMGKNSFFHPSYLPPDPPPGHKPHRYVFQIFALDRMPAVGDSAGRGEVLDAMAGHVIQKGCMLGPYERP